MIEQFRCWIKNIILRVDILEEIVANLPEEADNQSISLSGNTITLSGGIVPDTSVDLTPFLDNTDDQILSGNLVGTNLVLNLENGGIVTIPLASIDTDDQTLTLAGSNLSIQDGNTIDLSVFLDNTDDQNIIDFSITGTNLRLELENGGSQIVDLSPFLDNTDDQTLSLIANDLILEDGGSVDLSPYLDNTDQQTLNLVSNNLSISNGNTVNLSQYVNPTVNVIKENVRVVHAEGRITSPTGFFTTFESSVQRLSAGVYEVSFVTAHPNGSNYSVFLTTESDEPNRDQRKISYRNLTANGFEVVTTIDDNGAASDPYSDIPFSFVVFSNKEVVTEVEIV